MQQLHMRTQYILFLRSFELCTCNILARLYNSSRPRTAVAAAVNTKFNGRWPFNGRWQNDAEMAHDWLNMIIYSMKGARIFRTCFRRCCWRLRNTVTADCTSQAYTAYHTIRCRISSKMVFSQSLLIHSQAERPKSRMKSWAFHRHGLQQCLCNLFVPYAYNLGFSQLANHWPVHSLATQ